MNVRFYERFILHLMVPVLCVVTILAAFLVARLCTPKSKPQKLIQINDMVFKITILTILLLYPGLTTKIFQMFKCAAIEGVEGQLLVQDYAVTCHQGKHVTYTVVASISICVFVIGIPLFMFLLLFTNRKHLHDATSSKHHWVNTALGGLYLQCE